MFRTRDEPLSLLTVASQGAFYTTPSPVNWLPTMITFYNGTGRSMRDVVTPNFASRQKNGEIFNSPMSKTVEVYQTVNDGGYAAQNVTSVPGRIQYYLRDSYWSTDAGVLPDYPTEEEIASLRIEVAAKALANVSAPVWTGLVNLGELKETLAMMRRPLTGLVNLVKNFKRNRKSLTLQSFGTAARASWMEGRYGWRPFLYDLDNLAQALLVPLVFDRETSRARIQQTSRGSSVKDYEKWSIKGPVTYEAERLITCRAGVLYQYDLTMSAARRLGIRWEDIPAALFDLTPYSFVEEWFSNLGDLVRALTPKVGVNELARWNTLEVKRSTKATYGSGFSVVSGVPGWALTRSPAGSHTHEITYVVREPSLPCLRPVIRSGAKHPFTDLRVLDMISMFTQSRH